MSDMIKKIKKYLIIHRRSSGLTLIEVLVTASLIVFVTTTMLRSFAINKLNMERIANVVASDIRLAQSMALSSKKFQYLGASAGDPNADPVPRNRCGYGVSQDQQSDAKYFVYAGPPTLNPDGSPRQCNSRTYQPTAQQDSPAYKTVLLDSRMVFDTSPRFKDIFYEPPGPTTYFGNQNSPDFQNIKMMKAGLTQSQQNACNNGTSPNCIYICVYLSGRVEVTRSPTCP